MNRVQASIGNAPNKHFSNAVITWEISSFSLTSLSQKIICSPQITLHGPVETYWMMYLDISQKKNRVLLKLVMLSDNTIVRRVKVNWASCLLNEKEEGSFSHERAYSFEPKCRITVEMFSLGSITDMLSKKPADNLLLKCWMLVHFGLKGKFPNAPVDGVVALSNDLSCLPTAFLYHDITTTINNVEFSLNKAMLYQHGEKLANLIEQSTSDMKVNFPFTNPKAAEALFTYLYTGDLSYVLSNPSLTISDYIERLCIPELHNVYPQEAIKFVSQLDLIEHSFSWMVVDFKNVTKPLMGPDYYEDDMESRLQLRLNVKESKHGLTKKSLFVEAVLVDSEKSLNVSLEFACGKDENRMLDSRRIHGIMAVGDRLGVTLLDSRCSEMEECFMSETLVLKFTVRIRKGGVKTEIVENKIAPLAAITNERSFMNLSKRIGQLMKSHDYSDFHFEVEDKEFKAHKFLVAARSYLFQELFRRHENLVSVKVHSCPEDIFSEFLSYMYIGIIAETDGLKLIELHELGNMYYVCSLRGVCVSLLLKLINNDNMLRVLAFADDLQHQELRKTALNYVLDRANTLEDHPHLYFFQCTKKRLYDSIKSYIDGKVCDRGQI